MDVVGEGNKNRVIVLKEGPSSVFEEAVADSLADDSFVIGDANMLSQFISECVWIDAR